MKTLLCSLAAVSLVAQVGAASIESRSLRLIVAPSGRCELLDKQAGVWWRGETNQNRFGVLELSSGERLDLAACEVQTSGEELVATFHPVPASPAVKLQLRARVLPDQRTIEFKYQADAELKMKSIRLLDDVLGVTDSAKGYAVVPTREGLLIPADSGLAFTHRFDTYAYEGCHMEMFGAVQNGAAALVTWSDPYVAVDLKSTVDKSAGDARQRLSPSLVLTKSANSFRVQLLGKGDYVRIAKAYRDVARQRGLLVTWREKLKSHLEDAKLFGAANIKLWSTLTRRMNEESTKEESVRVNWTFDEAAQVAEHLKRDLKLERVLFTIGGWIHRGYDNQHPDILPTAPECGGDAAFLDCARRVMALGYLFCLHDNYQDIYRDSPSWDEKFIMKTPDGKPTVGGRWAGGRAYLTCSKMALELVQRPQNLAAVKKLSNANSYFIDTTYAAGLQECFDPAHPLSRVDDMKWKQALSDYGREVFGVFGSECGREWAIPHSDFFEGLTGVSGHYYHDANLTTKLGATVVPLFEIVYRDCIAMYGKYGYSPQSAAEYVLHHISIGRPLNYHSVPSHLYWKDARRPSAAEPGNVVDAALFVRADDGWAEGLHPMDRFIKNTCEVLCPLNELTSESQMTGHEFLTADRKVQRSIFGSGANELVCVVNSGTNCYQLKSKLGGEVMLPRYGFVVEGPTFAAFHASTWNGVNYEKPTLFTLRSLDQRPLSRSKQVRVFHAFGSDQIRIGKGLRRVRTETIIDATKGE